jgi:hypothetical protein
MPMSFHPIIPAGALSGTGWGGSNDGTWPGPRPGRFKKPVGATTSDVSQRAMIVYVLTLVYIYIYIYINVYNYNCIYASCVIYIYIDIVFYMIVSPVDMSIFSHFSPAICGFQWFDPMFGTWSGPSAKSEAVDPSGVYIILQAHDLISTYLSLYDIYIYSIYISYTHIISMCIWLCICIPVCILEIKANILAR